jgi:hypothetical protein
MYATLDNIHAESRRSNTGTILRRAFLLGVPGVLGILELFHPTGDPAHNDSIVRALLPQVDWWNIVHLIQLPLFGLIAMAVLLLIQGRRGIAPTVSRVGVWFFMVFYIAFDTLSGISVGFLVRYAGALPPEASAPVEGAVTSLIHDPIIGDGLSLITGLGVIGWVLAVFGSCVALSRAGAALLPVICLGLSVLFASHPTPIGPIGMFFFFVAVALLELAPQRLAWRTSGPVAQTSRGN